MSVQTADNVWGLPMTEDDVKEATARPLIPAGTYEGQLLPLMDSESVKIIKTDRGDHPLEGKAVARLCVQLFTPEGDRYFFFDAIPELVKAVSRAGREYIRQESQHGAMLYKATGKFGIPFPDVLDYCANTRLNYTIGVTKERVDEETGRVYEAQNTLKKVTA